MLRPVTAQVAPRSIESYRQTIPLNNSMAVDELANRIIQAALERTCCNVNAAARLLGATRETHCVTTRKYRLSGADPADR
jgi:transcriptional regulator with GAF, ATPase, and Fis domain